MTDNLDPGFFALPPFKPDEALARLRRDLREAGLTEREGQFESKGQALARAAVDGDGALQVALAKRPSRSPEWLSRTVKDSAQLRDFIQDVKRHLASWREDD